MITKKIILMILLSLFYLISMGQDILDNHIKLVYVQQSDSTQFYVYDALVSRDTLILKFDYGMLNGQRYSRKEIDTFIVDETSWFLLKKDEKSIQYTIDSNFLGEQFIDSTSYNGSTHNKKIFLKNKLVNIYEHKGIIVSEYAIEDLYIATSGKAKKLFNPLYGFIEICGFNFSPCYILQNPKALFKPDD